MIPERRGIRKQKPGNHPLTSIGSFLWRCGMRRAEPSQRLPEEERGKGAGTQERLQGGMSMPRIVNEATRQVTRERILREAASEFARLGFDQANINHIADHAGIGRGTLYLYFP